MAYDFASGAFVGLQPLAATRAVSFNIKTTQATSTIGVIQDSNTFASQNGYLIGINHPGFANKLFSFGFNAGGNVATILGAATINDGVWHRVVVNWNMASGSTSSQYIDGALDVSAVASAAWSIIQHTKRIGGVGDPFWGRYVGSLAEFGTYNRNLTAEEIAALNAGFSPPKVARQALIGYAPLVRNTVDRYGSSVPSGTLTPVDHPRVF